MNERIEALKKLATKEVWSENQYNGAPEFDRYELDTDMFAELIVRECIDKITTYDLVPGHSAKWEDIYDIHVRLLQDLGEELKEHFGIEE